MSSRGWLALGWGALLFALGAAATTPLAELAAALGAAHHPNGDRQLFGPSADGILDLLVAAPAAWIAASRASLWLGVAITIAMAWPAAALLQALQARAPWREQLARGAAHVPAWVFLGGLATLCQAAVGLLAALLFAPLVDPLEARLPAPWGDLAALGLGLLGMLSVALVGALRDLARALVVAQELSGVGAAKAVLGVIAGQKPRLFVRWALYGALGLAALVLGLALSPLLRIDRPGAWRVVLLAALHLAALVLYARARIAWFDAALSAVQPREAPR